MNPFPPDADIPGERDLAALVLALIASGDTDALVGGCVIVAAGPVVISTTN